MTIKGCFGGAKAAAPPYDAASVSLSGIMPRQTRADGLLDESDGSCASPCSLYAYTAHTSVHRYIYIQMCMHIYYLHT